MTNTIIIYLIDKNGQRGWRTTCGIGFHQGELNNMRRNLETVRSGKVRRMDPASTRLVAEIDGVEVDPDTLDTMEFLDTTKITQDDIDLLAELGL